MRDVVFKTELRTYYLEEVFEEFNGLLLFLATDDVNTKYLVCASYQNQEYGHWLLVPISTKRLYELIDDELSILEAYRQSETGSIIRLRHEVSTKIESEELLKSEDIADDWLPGEDFYLSRDILNERHLEDQSGWVPAEDRDFMASTHDAYVTRSELHVVKPGVKKQRFTAKQSGEILTGFEELRLSMLLDPSGRNTNVTAKMDFKYGSNQPLLQAGSITFILESLEYCLAPDEYYDTFKKMHQLLQLDPDSDAVVEELKKYHRTTHVKYMKFIGLLISMSASFDLRTASVGVNKVLSTALDSGDLEARKYMLTDLFEEKVEPKSLHGRLFGLEPHHGLFSFVPDGEDLTVISGSIEKDLRSILKDQTHIIGVKGYGTASIESTITFTPDGEIEKEKHLLIGYEPDVEKEAMSNGHIKPSNDSAIPVPKVV